MSGFFSSTILSPTIVPRIALNRSHYTFTFTLSPYLALSKIELKRQFWASRLSCRDTVRAVLAYTAKLKGIGMRARGDFMRGAGSGNKKIQNCVNCGQLEKIEYAWRVA